jgi:hypothetical protein
VNDKQKRKIGVFVKNCPQCEYERDQKLKITDVASDLVFSEARLKLELKKEAKLADRLAKALKGAVAESPVENWVPVHEALQAWRKARGRATN